MKTIEAIKGNEERLLSYYSLPPITNNRHYQGECPLCGKRKKFRLHYHGSDLRYICVCGNGSLISLIMETQGKDFKSTCNEIDSLIGNKKKPSNKNFKREISKAEQMTNRFKAIQKIINTDVETYLRSRGIVELPQMSVKLSNSEWDGEYGRSFKAMYAVATDEQMNLAYCHKTYLEKGKKGRRSKRQKDIYIKQIA